MHHEGNGEPLIQELDLMKHKSEDNINMNLGLTKIVGCSIKPDLSYGINSEIGCASNSMLLKYSEDKGRYLVATRNINPGEIF